jgi:hypothetical protein
MLHGKPLRLNEDKKIWLSVIGFKVITNPLKCKVFFVRGRRCLTASVSEDASVFLARKRHSKSEKFYAQGNMMKIHSKIKQNIFPLKK